jgi:hypothetical protein
MSDIVVTADPTATILADAPSVSTVVAISQQLPPTAYGSLSGLPTLGTAAALNVGTAANQVVELDGSARLPGVDGSQLINLGPRDIHCGRLVFVSTTQIALQPFKGDLIQINGLLQSIPAGGVTISNGGLAASTLYLVYAWMNGAALALELSTTTHTISTTAANIGTEIKSGDDTRSLVGAVLTNVSSQFVDSATQRFVRSWLNDNGVVGAASSTANTATSSASVLELDSAVRVAMLLWANEQYLCSGSTSSFNNTSASGGTFQVGVNGAAVGLGISITQATAGFNNAMANSWTGVLSSDGLATFSLYGAAAGNTQTYGNKTTSVETQRR